MLAFAVRFAPRFLGSQSQLSRERDLLGDTDGPVCKIADVEAGERLPDSEVDECQFRFRKRAHLRWPLGRRFKSKPCRANLRIVLFKLSSQFLKRRYRW